MLVAVFCRADKDTKNKNMANKTALKKLIDYMQENYHLTDESLYEFKKALEEEQKQMIDFGSKMQMVRDVDFDGNIDFMFTPETAFIQMFKNN